MPDQPASGDWEWDLPPESPTPPGRGRRTLDPADDFRRTVIFTIAGIYGLLVLTPFLFMERIIEERTPGGLTHPEYYYGSLGAGLVMQLVYLTIGRDPVRYRPLMPIGTLAKLAFFVPVLILLTVSGRWLYSHAAPVMPALQSYWLPIHVSVVSLGPAGSGPHNMMLTADDSRLVVTDSGGVQEETSALGIPCLTYRDNTERAITCELGTNRLVGVDPAELARAAEQELARTLTATRPLPLWDGHAGERAADAILELVMRRKQALQRSVA